MDVAALAPFLDAHKSNITAFKATDSRLAAVEGDRDKAIKAWMEGADDETATKLRAAVEEATRRLRILAEQSVKSEDLSEVEKERLKTEHSELKDKVRAGSRSLQKLAETFGLDISETLKELGDPTARSQSTNTGSGLPRASVTVKVHKEHDPTQTWDLENLSKTADLLDLPVEEMQKLYAQAGGVEHQDIKNIKEPTEFTYKNAVTGTVWVVQTTPKETAPRGRKAVEPKDPAEIAA